MIDTPRTPFVSMEEAGAVTGLTEKQIRFDVKHGYLPGTIDNRNAVRIRRGEWNDYLTGEWEPAEPGSHKKPAAAKPRAQKPVGIVSITQKAS